jgi:dCMP deaminase
MARPEWEEYYVQIAKAVATRATCNRKHVGAVIVRDQSILATGYNGSVKGTPHCDSHGHIMEDGHCVRTVHAEANAVAQAAKRGVSLEGGTAYVTCCPCRGCFQLLANAGVREIIYAESYRNEAISQMALEAGVKVKSLESSLIRPKDMGLSEDLVDGLNIRGSVLPRSA